MQDWWDIGQVGCRKGGRQERREAGKNGDRKGGRQKKGGRKGVRQERREVGKGGMKERRDSGLEGCGKEGIQDWRDTGLKGYRKGGIQERRVQDRRDTEQKSRDTGEEGFWIQERRDAGQEEAGKAGFRTRGKQKRINAKQEEYRLDAGLKGCRKGGMQVGMSTIINVLR